MKHTKWAFLALIVAFLTASLGFSHPAYATNSEVETFFYKEQTLITPVEAEWSYEGHKGPDYWESLSSEYKACGQGSQQSPINIDTKENASIKEAELDLVFDYNETIYSVEDNDEIFQANSFDLNNNTLMINEDEYRLHQVALHTPSEHTIDEEEFPLEIQLVHENEEEEQLIISVLVEEGKENKILKDVWMALPAKDGVANRAVDFDATELIPELDSLYTYEGSLTTPPCTENVTWIVSNETVSLSEEQIKAVNKVSTENNRPVQELGSRDIFKITP
ncbi:carbonic anhydrase [Alkalicoccobacillus porphyridii]|uniref:carbonic anhydrase n=1 Tax=Alkalicoccobacillus porphyridii TaxID=2597270 RepID=A0A553ZTQ4_9BACI|nr:carbonic anhydrase family protein [Alkalicoccobacillus porphyridii]TSB44696.1 carbonic anhydrase family protein [Alkalicoccobacillus porphyridii]